MNTSEALEHARSKGWIKSKRGKGGSKQLRSPPVQLDMGADEIIPGIKRTITPEIVLRKSTTPPQTDMQTLCPYVPMHEKWRFNSVAAVTPTPCTSPVIINIACDNDIETPESPPPPPPNDFNLLPLPINSSVEIVMPVPKVEDAIYNESDEYVKPDECAGDKDKTPRSSTHFFGYIKRLFS